MTAVLAVCIVVVSTFLWLPAAQAYPGELDTTFAGDGIADTDSPRGVPAKPSVAVYSDARTVLGASARDVASNRSVFSVWRFTPTGAFDPTFGVAGNGLVDFPGFDSYLAGVAVQPDGKLVLAGTVCAPRDPQSPESPTNCNVAAARLLPTGRLDPAFAFAGKIVVPMGELLVVQAVVVDRLDASILIAGRAVDPLSQRGAFALLRLRPSGWPDPSFGTDGKVWVTVSAGGRNHIQAAANTVAVQATGKIVLAGWTTGGPGGEDMALARVNRDGSLDTSFASGGTTVLIFARGSTIGSSRIQAMALQVNDDIVVGGYGFVSGSPFYNGPLIRRLTKDGLLDAWFSGGATGMILEDLRDSNNYIHGVAMQADDKIVVTGWHYRQPPPPQGPTEPQYIAYRLQPAGGLDPSFGVGGFSMIDGGIAYAVTVQRHGCIVLAGLKNYPNSPPAEWQAVAIRLVGDPAPRSWHPPCRALVPIPGPDVHPPILPH
jgi:uncharacterized delta-60 repeat protein